MAFQSCGELRTQLYISRKLRFIKKADSDGLVAESKEISAMLHGLARAVVNASPKSCESPLPKLKPEN